MTCGTQKERMLACPYERRREWREVTSSGHGVRRRRNSTARCPPEGGLYKGKMLDGEVGVKFQRAQHGALRRKSAEEIVGALPADKAEAKASGLKT
jgi:hypothetical protein